MNIMSRHQQKTNYSPLLDANRYFKDELLRKEQLINSEN